MNQEEHRRRHMELYDAFDELVADCMAQTRHLPETMTVGELIRWADAQVRNPTNICIAGVNVHEKVRER